MPIQIPCPCGKTLKVQDHLMGKKVKCPACAEILDVPASPPPPVNDLEVIFDEIASTPRPSKSATADSAISEPSTTGVIATVAGGTATMLFGICIWPSLTGQGMLTLTPHRIIEDSRRLVGTRHAELLLRRVDSVEIASYGNARLLVAGIILLGAYGLGLLFLLAFFVWRSKYLVVRSGATTLALRIKGDTAVFQEFLEALLNRVST